MRYASLKILRIVTPLSMSSNVITLNRRILSLLTSSVFLGFLSRLSETNRDFFRRSLSNLVVEISNIMFSGTQLLNVTTAVESDRLIFFANVSQRGGLSIIIILINKSKKTFVDKNKY